MQKYIDTAPVIDWLDDGIKDKSVSEDTREAYRRLAAMLILDIPAASVRQDLVANIEKRDFETMPTSQLKFTAFYCGNCRTVVRPEDNFCSRCGARFVK